MKKIVVHNKNDAPNNITLSLFLKSWDILITLGYRNNDVIYNEIERHKEFLNKYLETIQTLRNHFIHGGYSEYLKQNDYSQKYILVKFIEDQQDNGNGFKTTNKYSSELELDAFVKEVTINTRKLVTGLLKVIKKKLSNPNTKIPF